MSSLPADHFLFVDSQDAEVVEDEYDESFDAVEDIPAESMCT